VSRTHKGFLKRLFELEVPEIHSGTVEIRAIAREAGSRSKVAVSSRQEGLDPVGATVGQRGARVQAVVAELGGEKIDVIPWNDDPGMFVANALSPAQVLSVDIDQEHRIANVTVPERMLSLAIGREGQNARLAARLTGWRIDIRSDVSVAEAKAQAAEAKVEPSEATAELQADAAEASPDGATPTAAPAKKRATRASAKAAAAAETEAGDPAGPQAAAAEAAPVPAIEPVAATDEAVVPADEKVAGDDAAEGDAELAAAGAGTAAKPRAKRTKAAAGEVAS
jgi:N utilization substance protein A